MRKTKVFENAEFWFSSVKWEFKVTPPTAASAFFPLVEPEIVYAPQHRGHMSKQK